LSRTEEDKDYREGGGGGLRNRRMRMRKRMSRKTEE